MTDVVANGETGAAVDNAEGKTYDEELVSCRAWYLQVETSLARQVRVLMRHIEAGDLKSVQNSVSKLSVNCTLPDSLDTPLHTACFSGSREIVSWLLKKGANANAGQWS
jgi:ankyrin repeat protein